MATLAMETCRRSTTQPTRTALEFRFANPMQTLQDLSALTSACARTLGEEPWYGKVLRGGWPGVKGEVRLGVPVRDRFGEVLLVTLSEGGVPKSRVLA